MTLTISFLQLLRIIFFYFVVLFSGIIYSQNTTTISDDNFEIALINQGIDTNGLTGDILNSDAEIVTTLNIYNKSIHDLTGIEAFSNLKNLYVYNNNISHLDLSKNIALRILDIENNSLETLDISQNLDLVEIYVSNNLLHSLNVEHLFELELLSSNLNNLSTLNLTQNLALEVLWCYSNNLTSLDVSNNYVLETLFLDDNHLSALNISNNFELQTLSISNNNLSTISFSHCADISYINVSNNELNQLDLIFNPDVKRLMCDNNNITELELFNAPDLFLLNASNNKIDHIDVSMSINLRYILLQNNSLQSMDIRNNSNDNVANFNTEGNLNLTCIFVDNVNASFLSDWNIDEESNFVSNEEDCSRFLTIDAITARETISLELYPNPIHDFLNIKNLKANDIVTIFNVNAQLVKHHVAKSGLNTLDITSLSSGAYFVKVASLNKSVVQRIIVN
ncbi:T9SS type A sorting domain-containing protein [Bizionia argentinensis JUB59]|uniref:T9SS type A sorting domain-containing protein n=1 Tax=Bizionia argentinensis JUB59 TaxID=1046627 RepID=G2E9M4_9FLAO|nr:T9SS type A sorting domain-containing protein [Bizionia argentinensis]EGV45071.1 T9SS type A sorting domain-containing protein [Bizionia argentinensis JUB59]